MKLRATITVDHPVNAQLTGVGFEDLSALDDQFVVENPNAKMIAWQAAKRGQHWARNWDGKTHLINTNTGSFPVGLVQGVRKALCKLGYKVKVRDSRPCALEAPGAVQRVSEGMLKGFTLHDYQVDSVRDAITQLGGIFHIATGGGKTLVGSALTKALDQRTLYVVPNTKLVTQTSKVLVKTLGLQVSDIGLVKGGVFAPQKITIAVVNSLLVTPPPKKLRKPTKAVLVEALVSEGYDPETITHSELKRVMGTLAVSLAKEQKRAWKERNERVKQLLRETQVLILDETHHAGSRSWMKVIKSSGAFWKFGLSATPFDRSDGKSLFVEAYCGPRVARVSNDDLIKRGLLALPIVRVKEINTVIDYNDREVEPWGSYDEVYKAGIVRNKAFHEQVVSDALRHVAKKRPCLVLVKEHECGYAILQRFEDEGFGHAAFAHGKQSDEEVDETLERFARGDIRVLIGSPVLGEGMDMPDVRSLVIADDFKSVILILQRIGRGIRKKRSGENLLHVTDYAHTAHKYLADHSLERITVYEREKFDVRYA